MALLLFEAPNYLKTRRVKATTIQVPIYMISRSAPSIVYGVLSSIDVLLLLLLMALSGSAAAAVIDASYTFLLVLCHASSS